MQKFYAGVIKGRKIILVTFVLATVFCFLISGFVAVNYDMNDYLPADSPSTIALDVMGDEFAGGIPNARVLLNNVSVPEALAYKEQLKTVDGVTDVTWLDDAVNIRVPLETMDADTVETYYKNGAALMTVTIDEDKRIEAVHAIRALIGDGNAMSGSAVSTVAATENTVSEVSRITVIAIAFVLFVLLLTTSSWLEPFVVLVGLGIAIMINKGSNLIFGEISFVTNAAGTVLQLAVSLDYCVFLIHRYSECLKEICDPKKAMVDALCKSTSSILSSGLTTVIGLLALLFMRFGIGSDLGLALAKGVAISLITVFVFMPALILATYPLMQKTSHGPLLPSFEKFGHFICHSMIPCVCLFAIVLAPAYLGSNANSFYYGSGHIFGTDTQVGADAQKIEKVFGLRDTYVLLVPKGSTATETALSDELHTLPEVKSIISYVDAAGAEIPQSYLDADTLSKLESANYSRMVLTVQAASEGEATFSLVEKVRAIAEGYYPGGYYLAG